LNDVQEKWLGTLTSVPNKGKKVPRHAPACLIGCAAYECWDYRQSFNDKAGSDMYACLF